jgi:excisionase family DNA binding protein
VVKRAVRRAEPFSNFDLRELVRAILVDELKHRRIRAPLPTRAASIADRAKQVGLSEGTLEKEIREGRLEAFKVKARTLIGDEAFDRWLAARERIKPKRPPASQHEPEILEAT